MCCSQSLMFVMFVLCPCCRICRPGPDSVRRVKEFFLLVAKVAPGIMDLGA